MKPTTKYKIDLLQQEMDDLMSAVSFFVSDYPDKYAVTTKTAMRKLLAKLWKIYREKRSK